MFWTNLSILWNSKFYFSYFIKFFEGNLAFIWPFFIFQDLAFLKLLMAKFGLFNFFDLAILLSSFSCTSSKVFSLWRHAGCLTYVRRCTCSLSRLEQHHTTHPTQNQAEIFLVSVTKIFYFTFKDIFSLKLVLLCL